MEYFVSFRRTIHCTLQIMYRGDVNGRNSNKHFIQDNRNDAWYHKGSAWMEKSPYQTLHSIYSYLCKVQALFCRGEGGIIGERTSHSLELNKKLEDTYICSTNMYRFTRELKLSQSEFFFQCFISQITFSRGLDMSASTIFKSVVAHGYIWMATTSQCL